MEKCDTLEVCITNVGGRYMFFKASSGGGCNLTSPISEIDIIGDVELVNMSFEKGGPAYHIVNLNTGEKLVYRDWEDPLQIILEVNKFNLCKLLGRPVFFGVDFGGSYGNSSIVLDNLIKVDTCGEDILIEGYIATRFAKSDKVTSWISPEDAKDYNIVMSFTEYLEVFHAV